MLVRDLIKGRKTWSDVEQEMELFEGQETITK